MSTEKIKVGAVFATNRGGDCVVLENNGWKDVRVQFLDAHGYITSVQASHLRVGNVYNPYSPIVCGIGYMGSGVYKSKSKGKETREYASWSKMLKRCSDPKGWPNYIGCSVNPDWHNFQNFAEWANHQEGWGKKGFEIDKDFLVPGNKEYSPNKCIVIPSRINKLMPFSTGTNGLPPGVSFYAPSGRFVAKCWNGEGKNMHLGYFDDPEDAFLEYKKVKTRIVRGLAEEYKDQISRVAYLSLSNYEALRHIQSNNRILILDNT